MRDRTQAIVFEVLRPLSASRQRQCRVRRIRCRVLSPNGTERRLLRDRTSAPPSARVTPMMAPLSDRQRWGINAGASLGHHRATIGARCKLRAHTIPAEARCARPMIDAADLRSLCLLSAVRPAGAAEPYSSPRLSAAAHAAAPAAWRSSPPSAAPRRASADLVAERCDAAICPEWGRSGSARLALETTLMTPKAPTLQGLWLFGAPAGWNAPVTVDSLQVGN